jgi:[acyl-carrier-protein] S-malonyltransferase
VTALRDTGCLPQEDTVTAALKHTSCPPGEDTAIGLSHTSCPAQEDTVTALKHTHSCPPQQDTVIAAWVGDRPIMAAEVDRRLTALREGPLASRLPPPDTSQGRNLRRWLVQVLTVEELVAQEAAARAVVCEPCDGGPGSVTLAEALRAGGVSAAVLAANPLARALRRRVVEDVRVPGEQVRSYYDRNRDRHAGAYAQERPVIEEHLAQAARERAFTRWLDRRHAELVRLEPGFEHPADPHQPDADHRH